jgi:hypothetical protein
VALFSYNLYKHLDKVKIAGKISINMVDKVKLLVYVAIIISAIFIIRDMLMNTPATRAYLVSDVLAILTYTYAFYKSKDKFWLIMLASTVPMLVSDMYFLPAFEGLFWVKPGGMNTWAGIHRAIICMGSFFYFKKSSLRYALPILLFTTFLTNWNIATNILSRSAIGVIVGFSLQTVSMYYLIYYGLSKKKFIFSLGAVIELIGFIIVILYYFYVSHDITPLTLPLTDKLFTFSRDLMAIGAII